MEFVGARPNRTEGSLTVTPVKADEAVEGWMQVKLAHARICAPGHRRMIAVSNRSSAVPYGIDEVPK